MTERVALGASDTLCRDAAEDMALAGGSALSCVLAGYFAAAGAVPGVLLSPMSLLVSGFGARRALDGRVRQPGLQAKRPRGFTQHDTIPDTARVGVPAATAAALVALGYDKERRVAAILRAGIAHAKRQEELGRMRVLEQVAQYGAGAFADAALHRPLIHSAGPSEGGALTVADFRATPEVDHAAHAESDDDGTLLTTPWDRAEPAQPGHRFIGAIDRGGMAALLCYRDVSLGLEVPELGLIAALCAQPVMRGVSRTRPGTSIDEPSPIAIRLDLSGRASEVRQLHEAPESAFRVVAPAA